MKDVQQIIASEGSVEGYVFSELAKGIRFLVKEQDRPDIIEWILSNKLLNDKGRPFEFDNHYFLVPVLRDWSPRGVVKKGAQIGFSVSVVLKEIYAAKYFHFNSIHSLPTKVLRDEFVPTKVDPLIDDNPAIKALVGRGSKNSTSKKKFGPCWVHWKGTKGDDEEIMTTADMIWNDEVDHSDPETIDGFDSRLSASDFKGRWDFSNPTHDNYGVCDLYDESDQKVLIHRCSRCRHQFYNDFFKCVDMGAKTYICPKCRRPLREEDRRAGEWKPLKPGRDISGYWINQMVAPWISAAEVIDAYQKKGERYFYKYVLAEGLSAEDSKITRPLILKNRTDEPPKRRPVIMGADQGNNFHVVIGNKQGIHTVLVLQKWEELYKLMRDFRVDICNLDMLPDNNAARRFQAAFPGRVFLNVQDKGEAKETFRFDFENNIIYSFKHAMISDVVRALIAGELSYFVSDENRLFMGDSDKDYKSYIGQATTLSRVEDIDADGRRRWIWKSKNKMDHFFMATCYYYAARQYFQQQEEKYGVSNILDRIPRPGTAEFARMTQQPGEDEWLYV